MPMQLDAAGGLLIAQVSETGDYAVVRGDLRVFAPLVVR